MDELLLRQLDRYEKMVKALTNYRKSPKERKTLSYVEARLDNLEKDWQSFKSTHGDIVALDPTKEEKEASYFTKDYYDLAEENYLVYKSELVAYIKLVTPTPTPPPQTLSIPASTSNQNLNAEIRLPRINIPTFSGKYTEFPSFQDLFSALIHNNKSLDDVQKLHYLKSSLTGEAEQLLKSVTITNGNYKNAWETIVKRYNNKRYISKCIFKRLFSLKQITTESSAQLKQLIDTTSECLNSLNNIGVCTQSWDSIIIHLTVSKLDMESHRLWEQMTSSDNDSQSPTFDELKQFIEGRFRSLEMIEPVKSIKSKSFHISTTNNDASSKCILCDSSDHYLYQCKDFAKKNIADRCQFVQSSRLCFNCLTPYHTARNCLRKTNCRLCHKRHHSLLCRSTPENERNVKERAVTPTEINQTLVSHFSTDSPEQNVLLATALVDVKTRTGNSYICRSLLDQGSQGSFVTENLVQQLGLKRTKINGTVTGLNENQSVSIEHMVEFTIQSRVKSRFKVKIKAFVLKQITNYLPNHQINVSTWPELEKISLADPGYPLVPNKIDLLLGAGVYSSIIDEGLMKGPSGVIAQNTHLGWIISGDTTNLMKSNEKQNNQPAR